MLDNKPYEFFKIKRGWIELITGCMFAGKTSEFIRRLTRYKFGKLNILVFKPKLDNRYSYDFIETHHGIKINAIPIENSKQLLEILLQQKIDPDVIGIDEIQFFDSNIVDVVQQLADQGYILLVNGLDKDFKNNPFKNVYELLPQAEFVTKLTAMCSQCGVVANRTQRLINNKPAKKDSPLILISGSDLYEARCRVCYQKPE